MGRQHLQRKLHLHPWRSWNRPLLHLCEPARPNRQHLEDEAQESLPGTGSPLWEQTDMKTSSRRLEREACPEVPIRGWVLVLAPHSTSVRVRTSSLQTLAARWTSTV